MIDKALLDLAEMYLDRLRSEHITFKQFISKLYTLIDVFDYVDTYDKSTRYELLKITQEGLKWK